MAVKSIKVYMLKVESYFLQYNLNLTSYFIINKFYYIIIFYYILLFYSYKVKLLRIVILRKCFKSLKKNFFFFYRLTEVIIFYFITIKIDHLFCICNFLSILYIPHFDKTKVFIFIFIYKFNKNILNKIDS